MNRKNDDKMKNGEGMLERNNYGKSGEKKIYQRESKQALMADCPSQTKWNVGDRTNTQSSACHRYSHEILVLNSSLNFWPSVQHIPLPLPARPADDAQRDETEIKGFEEVPVILHHREHRGWDEEGAGHGDKS